MVLHDQAAHGRVQRHVAGLAALARDLQVRHAAALMLEVLDGQLAQLLAAQCVIQQGGQDGPVSLALERDTVGRIEQRSRLVIAQRRCLALVALDRRAFHPLNGFVRHRVVVAQVVEQRRQRRQAVAHGHAAQGRLTLGQVVAPGDHMGSRDDAELGRRRDAGETHEVLQGVFVGPAGGRVA